jgi:hypothetical protein
MTKFKFFRGYVGTLDIMDGQIYATASLYYPRLDSNNEMERWYAEHERRDEEMGNHVIITHEQYMLNRDMMIEQERIRRLEMVNHSMESDNQIRLFQATTTITVNPTLWTKVKIFGTRVKLVLIETWKLEPIGVVVMTLLSSVLIFIGVMKLFGA